MEVVPHKTNCISMYTTKLLPNEAIISKDLLVDHLLTMQALTKLLCSKSIYTNTIVGVKVNTTVFYYHICSTQNFVEALVGKQASYTTVAIGDLCY